MKFKNHTLTQYLAVLSKKEPTPGGGSAAALTGATGTGLLLMVTEYSKGRQGNTKAVETRLTRIAAQAKALRDDLLKHVDLDAEAYTQVVRARKLSQREQNAADRNARKVSKNIAKLCYKAVKLAPFLAEKGNPYLISDVAVAVELLLAGYNGAMVLAES